MVLRKVTGWWMFFRVTLFVLFVYLLDFAIKKEKEIGRGKYMDVGGGIGRGIVDGQVFSKLVTMEERERVE